MEWLGSDMKVILPGKTEWQTFCMGVGFGAPADSTFRLHIECKAN